jgi:hypothetical protein
MNQSDKLYCQEYEELLRKHFSFLLIEHKYKLTFLKRQGRYASECTYGMYCEGYPKFQFGGETGPYVAVAPSTIEYSLESEGGAHPPWMYLDRLDNHLSGSNSQGRLLTSTFAYPKWEERLEVLSSITKRLLPQVFKIFETEESLNNWRVNFE